MSSPKLGSYLRTYRIKSGLTQKDVAALLGLETGSTISRTEKGNGTPSVKVILGYCVLFEAHPQELVPGIILDIENTIHAGAHTLEGQLKKRQKTPMVLVRLRFLEKLSQLMG
ncbi:MAG: helix-turn-helix transcriptional regulator [Candidatus Moranbacteria bacterium]|nr:helix-turn-helix transcriptional regulator [Candidatus Moranbacteria bacterium]